MSTYSSILIDYGKKNLNLIVLKLEISQKDTHILNRTIGSFSQNKYIINSYNLQ